MRIRKAVIPAAGFGTRVLPLTKAMPKEMIPIVDKPSIQWIVEEAVAAGIEEILIILSRGKSIVEDHFDRSPELEAHLERGDKQQELSQLLGIANLANIQYLRQQEMLGLGHAVYCAKNFVGEDPFAVLYGDDVIIGHDPAVGQLCRAYEAHGKGVAGIKPVPLEQISRYSSLQVEHMEQNLFRITDMIEKPAPGKEFSQYSILGRCVLPPEIFPILENTPRGAGGEIQLTDAMRTLMLQQGMIGVEYTGKRYDMGNKLGIMQANVEQALNHPEMGSDFAQYLKELAASLQ